MDNMDCLKVEDVMLSGLARRRRYGGCLRRWARVDGEMMNDKDAMFSG